MTPVPPHRAPRKRLMLSAFDMAAAISLLLCLAVGFLWIRSYVTVDDWFLIYRNDGSERLSARRGSLIFHHDSPVPSKTPIRPSARTPPTIDSAGCSRSISVSHRRNWRLPNGSRSVTRRTHCID